MTSLPNSIEAERSVIGSILLDAGCIERINNFLSPAEFFDEGNKLIYLAIISLFDSSQPVDLVTVATKLQSQGKLENVGGPEILAEMQNEVPVATHVFQYAQIVKNRFLMRELIKLGNNIVRVSKIGEAPVEKIIKTIQNEISHKKYKTTENSDGGIFDKVSDLKISDTMTVESSNFTWTIDCVDEGLGEPIAGTFYVVVGGPGVGKSTLMVDMALKNSMHANVAVFSLEMEKLDFLQDYVHTKIGKKRRDIARKNYDSSDTRRAIEIEKRINTSPVLFVDDVDMAAAGMGVNIDEIIKHCDDAGVDMVYIDSLSKLAEISAKTHVDEANITNKLAHWRNRRMDEGNPITIFIIHHLDKAEQSYSGSKKIRDDCGCMVQMTKLDEEDKTVFIRK